MALDRGESRRLETSPPHTFLPTALHCIWGGGPDEGWRGGVGGALYMNSLLRSSPLSPLLFLPEVPREDFCSCLVESPLAFHNRITLVFGPQHGPPTGGREMKELRNPVNRPLAKAVIHTLPDMKIQFNVLRNPKLKLMQQVYK